MSGLWSRLFMRAARVDWHRIAQLEYDLGFTDEPPPERVTDAPGHIVYYRPRPQSLQNLHSVLKDAWSE